MPQNPITLIGNLTDDPKLNRTAQGHTVCNFRLAANRSFRDENGNWKDTDHLYISGELWGPAAPNAKASLTKGMSVIAIGRLITDQWTETGRADDGSLKEINRQRIVLRADRLALDLTRHIASSERTGSQSHQAHEGLSVPARLPLKALLDEDRYLPEIQTDDNQLSHRQKVGAGFGSGGDDTEGE